MHVRMSARACMRVRAYSFLPTHSQSVSVIILHRLSAPCNRVPYLTLMSAFLLSALTAQREFQCATLEAAVKLDRPELLDIIVRRGFVKETDVFGSYGQKFLSDEVRTIGCEMSVCDVLTAGFAGSVRVRMLGGLTVNFSLNTNNPATNVRKLEA